VQGQFGVCRGLACSGEGSKQKAVMKNQMASNEFPWSFACLQLMAGVCHKVLFARLEGMKVQ
jgi:hypothetical protein